MKVLNQRNFLGRLLKRVGVILPAFCIIALLILINHNSWSQSRTDLETAKALLQKMGINAVQIQYRCEGNEVIFSAVISNPELAFKKGLGLADPRPTPVHERTKVNFSIGSRGRVTFYLDSQNRMKNTSNQSTSVHINKDLLPQGIEISHGSFQAQIEVTLPDLTINKIVVERVELSEESVRFRFSVWVRNAGDKKSDYTLVETDIIPGVDEYRSTAALSPGAVQKLTPPVYYYGWCLIGVDIRIRVTVDSNNKISESNENNNVKEVTFNTRTLVDNESITFN